MIGSVKQHGPAVHILLPLAALPWSRRPPQYSAAFELSRVCGSYCSLMSMAAATDELWVRGASQGLGDLWVSARSTPLFGW
jgi:hypothetical protein